MTTKAADEYSAIARRMKELGATSDAPLKPEEQPPEPVVGATVDAEAYLSAWCIQRTWVGTTSDPGSGFRLSGSGTIEGSGGGCGDWGAATHGGATSAS